MALGFGVLAALYPVDTMGPSVLPLLALYAMLLMAALIDFDTYLLPDALTIPATLVALLGAFLYAPGERSAHAARGAHRGRGRERRAGPHQPRGRVWCCGASPTPRSASGPSRSTPSTWRRWPARRGLVGGALRGRGAGAGERRPAAQRPRLPEPLLYGLWAQRWCWWR
jgi:hypothetical protein